jgi:hypothetical protein
MKEILFRSGYPTDKWLGVTLKPEIRLPTYDKTGRKIPARYEIWEKPFEGTEVATNSPLIKFRNRR